MDPMKFTEEEQQLLKAHFPFYESLALREKTPKTDAQRHFVLVIEGKARAETPHELAYAKLMRQRAREREIQRQKRESSQGERLSPEWFSREDYRKLRRNRYEDWRRRCRGE